MSRGFTIIAYNTETTDYVSCATVLSKSLKRVMPLLPVCLITDKKPIQNVFDEVILAPDLAPHSDWKLINDVHATLSPWKHTIKIEADMYVPVDISWWFDILKTRDMNICTTIRDFKNNISDVDFYRQTHIKNRLLNTYNAITYYSQCDLTSEFYEIVKDCFLNWKNYEELLTYSFEKSASTDVVYSVVAEILGRNNFHNPTFTNFSFAHMKMAINNLSQQNWTKQLIVEFTDDAFRINTFPQLYPVHYHVKEFSSVLGDYLES